MLHNISFVFQDVFLFNNTILNNIRLGREAASLEEVYQAAECADCTDVIMQSEKGYDTVIGEAGLRLSGGEKPRISMACAFLKSAPIVFLDEVSANVDAENEAKIQAVLQELLKDKTVIMIAHKLASLCNAGQILVIENGHIV